MSSPQPTNPSTSSNDPTLTSPSTDTHASKNVELGEADIIAERVLSESEPLPFRTRFPLGSTIGKGGMAEVFLGRDRVLNRTVAVKILHGQRRDPVRLHRFLREAQITAQLAHPNVVPVHAMENNGQGTPAFVMKCVEGETFKDYFESCKKARGSALYNVDEHGLAARLEHFLKVCDAISYAHARGVIHRDIKPTNLMRGAYGEVYVMDWGIARLVGETSDSGDQAAPENQPVTDTSGLMTAGGAAIGTPMYMPPEQAGADGTEVGPAADQFALGLVLYELLTLHHPRESGSLTEMTEAAQAGTRLPFGAESDEPPVPASLRAVTDRATQSEPSRRYASVDELAADIRRYLRNEELKAYPDNLARRVWRGVQRHPVKVMMAILIIVVLAAASTTVSLVGMLDAKSAAAERARILTGLVATVSDFVHEKDGRAAEITTLVESLGVQTENALRSTPDTGTRFPRPGDLSGSTAPADTALHERYGQKVSYLEPIVLVAREGDTAAATADEHRLGAISGVFRQLFVRGLPEPVEGAMTFDAAPQAALIRERSRIQYGYLGLESGLLLNYPGNAVFPFDYDPRKRPWYVRARSREGVHFGEPYPDASGSGYLVPCNRSIHDAANQLLGVVGIDVSLDVLLDVLQVPGLEHQHTTWLVDREGMLVARSEEKGLREGVGVHGDQEKRRRPIGVPSLEQRLKAGTHNGAYVDGETLYVFAQIRALGWYLVVLLDADAILDA